MMQELQSEKQSKKQQNLLRRLSHVNTSVPTKPHLLAPPVLGSMARFTNPFVLFIEIN